MKPRMYQDETGNCYTKQNRHDGNVSRLAYTVLKSSSGVLQGLSCEHDTFYPGLAF
jgi:hypothetical protein